MGRRFEVRAAHPVQTKSEFPWDQSILWLATEEAGRAEFNVATPTYATVAYSVR